MEDSRDYRALANALAAGVRIPTQQPTRLAVRGVRNSNGGVPSSRVSFIFVLIVMALLTTSPPLLVSCSQGLRGVEFLSVRLLSDSSSDSSGDAAAASASAAATTHHSASHAEDPAYDYSIHGEDWPGMCTDPHSRYQSPVDIVLKEVVDVPELGDLRHRGHYPEVQGNVSLYHNNHTFEISFHEDNRIRLPMFDVEQPYKLNDAWDAGNYGPDRAVSSKPRASTFHLKQCHLHCLSETEIDGRHFDVEIHCVHARDGGGGGEDKKSGSVGVWAVFMNRTTGPGGADCDPYLEKLLAKIPELVNCYGAGGVLPVELRGFSVSDLLPSDGTYIHYYPGSLTTPPCSEGLLWYVFENPIPICDRHFAAISDIVHTLNGRGAQNFRGVQPLHGRVMYRWKDPKPGTKA